MPQKPSWTRSRFNLSVFLTYCIHVWALRLYAITLKDDKHSLKSIDGQEVIQFNLLDRLNHYRITRIDIKMKHAAMFWMALWTTNGKRPRCPNLDAVTDSLVLSIGLIAVQWFTVQNCSFQEECDLELQSSHEKSIAITVLFARLFKYLNFMVKREKTDLERETWKDIFGHVHPPTFGTNRDWRRFEQLTRELWLETFMWQVVSFN